MGFAAVGGLARDANVGFEFEERGEGAADHGLVFGEYDGDGGFGCGGHGDGVPYPYFWCKVFERWELSLDFEGEP